MLTRSRPKPIPWIAIAALQVCAPQKLCAWIGQCLFGEKAVDIPAEKAKTQSRRLYPYAMRLFFG